jgi:hypothetical protein
MPRRIDFGLAGRRAAPAARSASLDFRGGTPKPDQRSAEGKGMPRVFRIVVVFASIAPFGLAPAFVAPALAQQATPATPCPATTEADNQAIVQRWFDALDGHDIAAFEKVFVPVVIQHAADLPDAAGVDEIKTNLECGKIAEEWSEADRLSFFNQLGVIAWPPATPVP